MWVGKMVQLAHFYCLLPKNRGEIQELYTVFAGELLQQLLLRLLVFAEGLVANVARLELQTAVAALAQRNGNCALDRKSVV